MSCRKSRVVVVTVLANPLPGASHPPARRATAARLLVNLDGFVALGIRCGERVVGAHRQRHRRASNDTVIPGMPEWHH